MQGSQRQKATLPRPCIAQVMSQHKHNARTFEESERLVDCVKSLLLRALFEWSRIWGFTHCHSLFEFHNSVSLSF